MTTVHWHGMHCPPSGRWAAPAGAGRRVLDSDLAGGSAGGDPVVPPASARSRPSGTSTGAWPDVSPDRRRATADLPLPQEYGVDDFPVIVQDKRFTDRRTLERTDSLDGRRHPRRPVVVNGTLGPLLTCHRAGPAAAAQRLHGALYDLVDRRPGFALDRDGRWTAASPPYLTGHASPANAPRSWWGCARAAVRAAQPPPRPGGRDDGGCGGPTPSTSCSCAPPSADGQPALPEQLVEVATRPIRPAVQPRVPISSGDQRRRWTWVGSIRRPGRVPRRSGVSNEDDVPHNFHAHDLQFQVGRSTVRRPRTCAGEGHGLPPPARDPRAGRPVPRLRDPTPRTCTTATWSRTRTRA